VSIEPKALSLMRLAKSDAAPNGWTPVSEMILLHMKIVPEELMETRITPDGGYVRLTQKGHTVLKYV
jgi:hypothetical protein